VKQQEGSALPSAIQLLPKLRVNGTWNVPITLILVDGLVNRSFDVLLVRLAALQRLHEGLYFA